MANVGAKAVGAGLAPAVLKEISSAPCKGADSKVAKVAAAATSRVAAVFKEGAEVEVALAAAVVKADSKVVAAAAASAAAAVFRVAEVVVVDVEVGAVDEGGIKVLSP